MVAKLFKPVDLLAFLLNTGILLLSVYLLTSHSNLPPMVPLWFSKPWGEERLSAPENLWLLPTLIFTFFLISNVSAKTINREHPALAKLLVWSSAFISSTFLFSLYKIILVVI